jgi:two-component system nitrogen regulation response regulator NtrX
MKSKYNILVVDDDSDMTETLSDILQENNFQVSIANNGFKAIETIKTSEIDLILMDLKMPGINGFETFREIEKIKPNVLVIFITAQFNEKVSYDAKADTYLIMEKPIDIENLLEVIKKNYKSVIK